MKNTPNLRLLYFEEMPKTYQDSMLEGLNTQAKDEKQLASMIPFSFSYVDQNNNFAAGISGTSIYGGLHIDNLYIIKEYRGRGFGTSLVQKAEELAKERECNFVCLSTMDFEAKPFYEKLGYSIEYARKGYDNDSVMYLMKKELINN